jgi:hypothetical protein
LPACCKTPVVKYNSTSGASYFHSPTSGAATYVSRASKGLFRDKFASHTASCGHRTCSVSTYPARFSLGLSYTTLCDFECSAYPTQIPFRPVMSLFDCRLSCLTTHLFLNYSSDGRDPSAASCGQNPSWFVLDNNMLCNLTACKSLKYQYTLSNPAAFVIACDMEWIDALLVQLLHSAIAFPARSTVIPSSSYIFLVACDTKVSSLSIRKRVFPGACLLHTNSHPRNRLRSFRSPVQSI